MKKILGKLLLIICIVTLMTISSIGVSQSILSTSDDDIQLSIEGFPSSGGITFTVKNNGSENITATYNISTICILRPDTKTSHNFTAFANATTISVGGVRFGIRKVCVTLSAGNETLSREGISIFKFVFLK